MSSSDTGHQRVSSDNWQQVRTDGDFRPEWLDQYQYALLNPLNVPAAEWEHLPCKALETPNIGVRPDMLPQMVFLDQLDREAKSSLPELMEHSQRRGTALFCALLKSRARPDVLSYHLRRQLEQHRAGSRQRWWLRFYNPEIFQHLLWILTPEQLEKLMGPIDEWRWLDGWGRWHCCARRTDQRFDLHSLFLTPEQWQTIDRLALLNGTLRRLANIAPEWSREAQHWQALDALLVDAERHHQLSRDEDRQLFAEQAARFHPRIHQHPQLHTRLSAQQRGKQSYTQLCVDLSPERMRAMADELENMS